MTNKYQLCVYAVSCIGVGAIHCLYGVLINIYLINYLIYSMTDDFNNFLKVTPIVRALHTIIHSFEHSCWVLLKYRWVGQLFTTNLLQQEGESNVII